MKNLPIRTYLKLAGLTFSGLVFLFFILFLYSTRFSNFVHNQFNYWIERAYEYRAVFARDNEPGVGPGKNLPIAKDPDNFSFAIMGDTQMFNSPSGISLMSGNYKLAASEIEKRNPGIVMTVGDLIQTCHDKIGCDAYRMWKNIDAPLLPITFEVMGNHDHKGGDFSDSQWKDYFTLPANGPKGYEELAYSFNFGNSHFVVLDSEHPLHKIDKLQQAWLDEDLTKNTLSNVFVFWHEPAWPMDDKKRQSLDAHSSLRNSLWSIIDKHNVTAVFNGHEHVFNMTKIDSSIFSQATHAIYQITSGHVDAPIKSDAVSNMSHQVAYYYPQGNYLMVNVKNQNITIDLYSIATDQLVKSFQIK